jgi:hypothetical protein
MIKLRKGYFFIMAMKFDSDDCIDYNPNLAILVARIIELFCDTMANLIIYIANSYYKD